jgi:hypothetical protein
MPVCPIGVKATSNIHAYVVNWKLDADIALVRVLNSTNTDSTTGAVTCNYRGTGVLCPLRSTWQTAAAFGSDNNLWLVS